MKEDIDLKSFIFILTVFAGLMLAVYLIGCTTENMKQYNLEDQQDGTCYGQYGGQFGYCTRSPK